MLDFVPVLLSLFAIVIGLAIGLATIYSLVKIIVSPKKEDIEREFGKEANLYAVAIQRAIKELFGGRWIRFMRILDTKTNLQFQILCSSYSRLDGIKNHLPVGVSMDDLTSETTLEHISTLCQRPVKAHLSPDHQIWYVVERLSDER